jgi:hypothetical protein
VKIAENCRMAVLGIIHHNKSGSTDPLQLVMGSRAFTAVARSVHTVILDPDDESEQRRLFGTPKNNLGRSDMPTLAFTIASHPIETEDGTAWTGKCEWGENSATRISDAIRKTAAKDTEDSGATAEAAQWLKDYLITERGSQESATTKGAGKDAGHSESALQRARTKLKVTTESRGYPRKTWWILPDQDGLKWAPASRVNSENTSRVNSENTSRVNSENTSRVNSLGESEYIDMTDTTESESPSRAGHVSHVKAPETGDMTVTPLETGASAFDPFDALRPVRGVYRAEVPKVEPTQEVRAVTDPVSASTGVDRDCHGGP